MVNIDRLLIEWNNKTIEQLKERIAILDNQLKELINKRTGYDTPEEEILEQQISKVQDELEILRQIQYRRELKEALNKRNNINKDFHKRMDEEIAKHIEAQQEVKPEEYLIRVENISGRADKAKVLDTTPKHKGTIPVNLVIFYQSPMKSGFPPLYLTYDQDRLGNFNKLTNKDPVVAIETDKDGLPIKAYFGYVPNRSVYDISVDTTSIPEGIKKLFADSRAKELEEKYNNLKKDTEELTRRCEETINVNNDLLKKNEKLKAEKDKRILNRLKKYIT